MKQNSGKSLKLVVDYWFTVQVLCAVMKRESRENRELYPQL